MTKKCWVALILIICLWVVPSWAAGNTLTKDGNMLTYTSDGSANDIVLATDGATDAVTGGTVKFPNGVGLIFIQQKSHAANDAAIVRNRAIDGNAIFDIGADITGDGKALYYGGERFYPAIKHGEVTSGCVLKMLITSTTVK